MRKVIAILFITLMIITFMVGCKKSDSELEIHTSPELQLRLPAVGDTIVVFDTSMGVFKAVLYPQYTPKSVDNFVTLAKNGYYNESTFHRVITEFIIQGGDPTYTGSGGDSKWMLPFEDEFTDDLHHYRGALCMVNTGKNTNKSQFFIVTGGEINEELINKMKSAGYSGSVIDAYREVGGRPTLDYNYTIFGQVYDGLDIIDAINAVQTNDDNRPKEDIVINSIVVDVYRNPIAE
ncbi:MAG: peptidylprolyl isomerase [Oscillospiraceae bacterium]|nr:peptidylprolyl isomerase [Oscillospiraceae bacterium]